MALAGTGLQQPVLAELPSDVTAVDLYGNDVTMPLVVGSTVVFLRGEEIDVNELQKLLNPGFD